MGDIEVMYYQGQVAKEQIIVLRYLSRENDKTDGDLVDHDVFFGTSSPICYNYTLQNTDNKAI